MALKVELKPNERVIIGSAVVRNTDQRTALIIEGRAPILRENDILIPSDATSPAKLVYLALQILYIDSTAACHLETYQGLCAQFLEAVPSATPIIARMDLHVNNGDYYRAIKEARKLVEYERKLLDHAKQISSVQPDQSPREPFAA